MAEGIYFDGQLLNLSAMIDRIEGYDRPHAVRIAILSDEIAKILGLTDYDRQFLRQAALLHDIGELVMNRDYLNANRALYEEERLDMQRHTVIGEQEVSRRQFPRAVQLLVRWHHEWWNGAGYPDALEREEIPLSARILRVADSFVSMTAPRSYRAAFSEIETREYLAERAGIEFDPVVVRTLLSFDNIQQLLMKFEQPTSSIASVQNK